MDGSKIEQYLDELQRLRDDMQKNLDDVDAGRSIVTNLPGMTAEALTANVRDMVADLTKTLARYRRK